MPKSGDQRTFSIAYHQDEIGHDPLDDMLPADTVMAQDCIIVILDAGAGMRGGLMEGALEPLFREFASLDGWIDADYADLVTLWIECLSVVRCFPRCGMLVMPRARFG